MTPALAQGIPLPTVRSWKSTIPLIDLSRDEESAAEDVRLACMKFGFFTIKEHGVSEQLVEEMFAQNAAFFALPTQEKEKILANKDFRGYTPMKEETLDPKLAKAPDSKEGLYFGREVAPEDPEAAQPLTGPNQWPSEELLPGYRETTEKYMAAMVHLGLRLVRLLALALRLPADYFEDSFQKPMSFLRPLHYTDEVSSEEMGLFAAGAHSDYGMLTILKTSKEGGLQIHLDGTWIDVEATQGCFIVNLGDMLERWSNCLFRSTVHRVLGLGKERYSIPFFFEPNFYTKVECLPQCCSADNPPRYPPTTSGQHILDMYSQTHASYKDKDDHA